MSNEPKRRLDRRFYNPPDHLQEEYGTEEWFEKWVDWMFPTMKRGDPLRPKWWGKRNDEQRTGA